MSIKIDTNNNAYTFIFSAILIVIVASILAFASQSLKPLQDRNIRREKMQNILSTLRLELSREESEKEFNNYIKKQLVLDYNGNIIGNDAFDVELEKELKKPVEKQQFPLYIAEKEGKKFYIVPMLGKGLWGPIWGHISFLDDLNTIYGTHFDHETETPGLGAEIKEMWFRKSFQNKKIFDKDGNFKSVHVIKGGAKDNDIHGVDAISGATITSRGVDEMIERTLKNYIKYFKKLKNNS